MKLRCYISYFFNIIQHKWKVLILGKKMGIPIWILLKHDISKFFPSEFKIAAQYLNSSVPRTNSLDDAYRKVQHLHVKRNKHHWQYWIMLDENNDLFTMKMPDVYVREYVADLLCGGIHTPGCSSVYEFYIENQSRVIVSRATRAYIQQLIEEYGPDTG